MRAKNCKKNPSLYPNGSAPSSLTPACLLPAVGGRVVAAGAVTSSRIRGGTPQTLKGIKIPYEEAGRWEGAVWRARPGRGRPDRPYQSPRPPARSRLCLCVCGVPVLTPTRAPWARNLWAPGRCGGRTRLAVTPQVPRPQPPLRLLCRAGDGGAGHGAGGSDSGASGGSCEHRGG